MKNYFNILNFIVIPLSMFLYFIDLTWVTVIVCLTSVIWVRINLKKFSHEAIDYNLEDNNSKVEYTVFFLVIALVATLLIGENPEQLLVVVSSGLVSGFIFRSIRTSLNWESPIKLGINNDKE